MMYLKYLKIAFKSLAEYRLNLLMTAIMQFASSALAFFSMYLLFDRFGSLAGYTFAEVALTFCVTLTAFALAECFFRGFDSFSQMIRHGTFDRVLLRPRSTVLQVIGTTIDFSRLGRLLLSIGMLVWAMGQFDWTPLKIITLLLMLISGTCLFAGVFILGATVCFFTVDGLEFINIFTDGAREFASYPLTIYAKRVTQFFTFIIPYASMNYLPLTYITGRTDNALYVLTPLFGILFLLPCFLVWHWGVRHYLSTGN
jgi:ABC-2 type transport system permease protein